MFVNSYYCKNILIILLLFLFASNVKSAQDNVEKYGKVVGEPIDGGFFFYDDKYIEAPYVVERRGLETFVNGFKVGFVPEPYDWRIMEDPGSPTADSKLPTSIPWPGTEHYDSYWGHKYRYIRAMKSEKQANLEFIEVIKKAPGVARIEEDSDNPKQAIIHLESGQAQVFSWSTDSLESGPFPPVQSKDELIKMAETKAEFYENKFRRNQAFFDRSNGGCMTMGVMPALNMVDILISKETSEDRAEMISKSFDKSYLREPWIGQLNSIKSTPQLVERAKRIRKEVELERQLKEMAAMGEANLNWVSRPENVSGMDIKPLSSDNLSSGNNVDNNNAVEAKNETDSTKSPVSPASKPDLGKKPDLQKNSPSENSGISKSWLILGIGTLAIVSIILVLCKRVKKEA